MRGTVSSESGSKMVTDLIVRMDRWLKANRPGYHGRLRPGATDAALDAFETKFRLRLPQSFRDLHKWRDGQDPACSESLQDNRMFSSLAEIAETKELLDGMIGYDFEDPRWWQRGWVPFLANGGGDHLCLDLEAEGGTNTGRVIAFWHDWEDRSAEYDSFDEWLARLVESMEAGDLNLV